MKLRGGWQAAVGWACLWALLTVALLCVVDDFDIWYHLAIGREIWARRALPAQEFLLFPLEGQLASFHEWAFGLLAFAAFRLGGQWGLALANAGLTAATFLALLHAVPVPPGGRRPYAAFAACALTLVWAHFRFVYRPEMILFVVLAIEVAILERALADGKVRRLYWLAALTWVLSQFHPSAIFVLAVLGAYGLQLLWQTGRGRRLAVGGHLAAVFLASGLAAMINPYGHEQVTLPLSFFKETTLLSGITEFAPALETNLKYYFLSLLVVSLLATVAGSRRRWVDAILWAAFAWLAFRHVRNLTLFALMTHVPLQRLLADYERRALDAAGWPRKAWVAGVAALLGLAGWSVASNRQWGIGAAGVFPEASARELNRLAPVGRVFNFYDYGGYLAWAMPGRKVFIDGRHYGMDPSLMLHDRIFRADPQWPQLLEELRVGAVVTRATLPYSGGVIPLAERLSVDPDWILAVAGDAELLFLRRREFPGYPARAQDPNGYWRQALREALETRKGHPDQPGALKTIGIARLRLGEVAEAQDALRRYLAEKDDDEVRQFLETL